ncbi:MAG: acyltransferase, partial [Gammaproteobacteria bacterium]|nr:acyltransferase [Gammaproteobacteria bacterium]
MRPKYLPRLDGLRAISIFLVLAEHFYSHGYEFGGYGVTLFFVISGYLITSILVSYAETLSTADAAKKFYLRRALRLAPPYYLCIFLVTTFNINMGRPPWWIDALYLSN